MEDEIFILENKSRKKSLGRNNILEETCLS